MPTGRPVARNADFFPDASRKNFVRATASASASLLFLLKAQAAKQCLYMVVLRLSLKRSIGNLAIRNA